MTMGQIDPDVVMRGRGFADGEAGPYVSKLRELNAKQVADGLVRASAGTWARPIQEIDAETRARALLAMDWAISRGHTYRVECLDPPIWWQYNARTMKRSLRVNWGHIPAWLGDRWREIGMHFRVWLDRNLTNPYAAADEPK